MGDGDSFHIDRRSESERVECPVCEKPLPSIDHPSFQHCIPYLVKRINDLEDNAHTPDWTKTV